MGIAARGMYSIARNAVPWIAFTMSLASGPLQAAKCSALLDSNAESLTFGHISVKAGDLFDPGKADERRGIHRIANALHYRSRDTTILQALPFRRGDTFSLAIVNEGERALRARRFLRNARITPLRQCGNEVDVEVRTVDNWTLTPSISYGVAGGVSRYILELQDLNVLGLGKELKLRLQKTGDEKETIFIYGDNNVLGGRHRLRLELSDTDAGKRYILNSGLPFYSTSSSYSWWSTVKSEKEALRLGRSTTDASDQATDDAASTTSNASENATVHSDYIDVRGAKKINSSAPNYMHLGVGMRFSRQDTVLPDNSAPPESSFDAEELYPYLYARWIHPDWVRRKHYFGIGQVEDINLGLTARLEAGLLFGGLGNENEGVRLASSIVKGWRISGSALHKLSLGVVRYIDSREKTKHSELARYQYFRWLTAIDQIEFQLTVGQQNSYSPLHDLRLGGEAGLKAYPRDYQRGDRRWVGVVEYRHVTHWNPYRLAHIGFTGFAEVGRVTGAGEPTDTIADVGIGLALAPTRSSQTNLLRIDIAAPVINSDGVADYQLFVGTRLVY